MVNFEKEISDFKNNGIYHYQFDEVGNVILNPSSSIFQQHYISLPTINYNYNESKILTFYPTAFVEFVPQQTTSSTRFLPQDVIDKIDEVTRQNMILQDQLDSLIAQSEFEPATANEQAVKDIILTLRMQLGQGDSASDFYDTFPYLPIPLDKKSITEI
jgi:hypothetical protein